jgi:hypothetical protein
MSFVGKTCALGLLAAAILMAPAGGIGTRVAVADELDDLFLRILVNPTDVGLNLQYARLAEDRGILRKALATYERILMQDPDNSEAQDGYYRIRRALEPAYTDITVSLGGRYETNARQSPKSVGRKDDFALRGQVGLRDERTLMGRRWRTEGSFLGDIHADVGDLDFVHVDAVTGPMFDIGSKIRLHTALGGSYAMLDGSDLYGEAVAKIGIEGILEGALQRVDLRLAYRDIGDRYSDAEGIVVDLIGRLTRASVLVDSDVFVFYPRIRYSEPTGGIGTTATPERLYPGDYFEYGGSTAYYYPLMESVLVGVTFSGYYRDYDQAILGGGKDREDFYIAPGAQLVFKDVLGPKTAVRVEYRYEQNFSNDSSEDFVNHVIGVRASKSF